MFRYKKGYMKIFFVVFGAALVITAVLEGHDSYVHNLEAKFYEEHMAGPLPPNSFCHIPHHDPFDPSILRYIKSWPKIDCGSPQPSITYAGKNGLIYINKTAVTKSKLHWDHLLCSHQEISRSKNDDDNVHLGPKKVTNLIRTLYILYVSI
jgi:hypothetical protein